MSNISFEGLSATCSMDELTISRDRITITKQDIFEAIENQHGYESLSTNTSLKSIIYNNIDRRLDKQFKNIGFKKVAQYAANDRDYKGNVTRIYTYILVLNNTFRREYNKWYKKNNE